MAQWAKGPATQSNSLCWFLQVSHGESRELTTASHPLTSSCYIPLQEKRNLMSKRRMSILVQCPRKHTFNYIYLLFKNLDIMRALSI